MNARGRVGLRVVTVTVALAAFALARVAGAQETGREGDGTGRVELPPFLVEEPGRPLRWHYLTMPGLELLTTCPPAVARSFAETHFRQEQLVRLIVPERFFAQAPVPMTVLLIDGATAKRITDDTMTKLLRAGPSRVVDWRDRARVMPNLRLDDGDSSVVLTLRDDRAPDDVTFSFATSRIAILLERHTPSVPPWVAAGLLGLYDQCLFKYEDLEVGHARWRTLAETQAVRDEPDWPRDVPPLGWLFDRIPDSSDAPALAAWREQATLFFRWAVLADGGAHRAALWRLVERSEHERPDDAMFRECFGFGFADARDRISDYLPSAVAEMRTLAPAQLAPAPRVTVRRATPLEVGRIRGEWERLAARFIRERHPELAAEYLEHARATLAAARRAVGDAPGLLAVSGLLEYNAGNRALARNELERALAAGGARPLAAFTLARLRYDEAREATPAEQPLDPAATGLVLAPLEQARARRPALPQVYALLGDLWMNSAMTPDERDLAALREGARIFPSEPGVVGRVALLLALEGKADAALTLLDESLARTAGERRREPFERARARLRELADSD